MVSEEFMDEIIESENEQRDIDVLQAALKSKIAAVEQLKEKFAQARDKYLNDRPHLSTAERHEAMKAFDAANSSSIELIEIIKSQSECIEFLNKRVGSCAYSQIDKFGNVLESVYRSTNNSLSETTTRLQKLRDGK